VAGKTGTAHKLQGKAYAPDKYVSSFVGMAPASDPRLLVAVMIDEPDNGDHYGGVVAAPVFSAVMADALRMLSVPPDAPATLIEPGEMHPGGALPEVREEV
jgi:cell division protein FtsI (penicillin-binding protein 3)